MKNRHYFIGSIVLFLVDFVLKQVIRQYLVQEMIIIPNFFSLYYIENEGAAFGMLNGARFFFLLISFACLYLLIKELLKAKKPFAFCYMLIIGGLLGNLVDRLFFGYVIDYLSFTIFQYQAPIFNFADILIVVGIFLLIIQWMKGEKYDV